MVLYLLSLLLHNKLFYIIFSYISYIDPPPAKQVHNPYAIERPHAPPTMLQRQNSFRGFSSLNQASPFKRQLSLRIGDLPSTQERQRSMSVGSSDMISQQNGLTGKIIFLSVKLVSKC